MAWCDASRTTGRGDRVEGWSSWFGEGLLFIFEFFLLCAWIWILISVISDLFRDHELSGVAKAVWVFFLVFLPFLRVLLYLIVRGDGMRDRTIKAKPTPSSISIHTCANRPTREEFERAKSKLLA